jgi:hypothetical protein
MLTEQELKNLIVGLGIERHNGQLPGEEEVAHWMREFDTSNDKMISKEEFLHGIEQWINFTRSFKKKSPRSSLGTSAQPLIWDAEAQVSLELFATFDHAKAEGSSILLIKSYNHPVIYSASTGHVMAGKFYCSLWYLHVR